LTADTEVVSRGFVYMRESVELIEESKKVVSDIVRKCYNTNKRNIDNLNNLLRFLLTTFNIF
ncbi:MAG: hypothetical protein IKF79_07465, partial [Methanosphaera sp.]|nr:hypothetical protein [Methanosphaera sp.]